MFDFLIAGVHAPPLLLVLTGFTVGMVGGFIGVGGGYMVTPALIVFGFPGYMASGIDMSHIAGKGVVSTIRHRQLGNIDWVLALTMAAGTVFGVEVGIRVLDHFKQQGATNTALLATSVVVMFALFAVTIHETRRAHRRLAAMARDGARLTQEVASSSLAARFQAFPLAPIVRCRTARVVISMWVIVLVGVLTGILAGFLGVGGGFIRVPALVYLIGVSTHVAVGTDLVEIVFSGAYGCLRHTMEGNVDFVAVMFMLLGAMVGAQVGSIATSRVRGPAIRYVLSYSLGLAALGSAVRLAGTLGAGLGNLLGVAAVVVTLGEMLFLCFYILLLVYWAARAGRGRAVPGWILPLLVRPAGEPAALGPGGVHAGNRRAPSAGQGRRPAAERSSSPPSRPRADARVARPDRLSGRTSGARRVQAPPPAATTAGGNGGSALSWLTERMWAVVILLMVLSMGLASLYVLVAS